MPKLNPTYYLSIDLGDKRIGIAAGSSEGGLARPLETIDRSGGEPAVFRRIKDLVKTERTATIVIGDPINMDGTHGERSELSQKFASNLKKAIRQANIILYDERLSSFAADEWMEADNIRPSKRKEKRDAYAAAIILKEFFATQKHQALPS